MWFFNCPEFFFGPDALSRLAELQGQRAFIVTDANIVDLGYASLVQEPLRQAGIESAIFAEVEPEPSLQTVRRGARAMLDYAPDWVIGLGGGSSMDAAKAMWILYEQPEMEPEAINPFEEIGLRNKARLITIPTTAGTGSESNYAVILTDTQEQRKLTLGAREAMPDIAIVDPVFTARLPRQVTADTGIDVLTHAVEAFTSTWANDFTDGLCLHAARLVFDYLPRVVANGVNDEEAREKMANAASIAGITLGNSTVALAHALGHSAGAVFKTLPHGRITALFLPYTIEFVANVEAERFVAMARALGLGADTEAGTVANLVKAIRELLREIDQPATLQEAGVSREAFEAALPEIVVRTEIDANILSSRRIPETEEVEQLYRCAFDGHAVDF